MNNGLPFGNEFNQIAIMLVNARQESVTVKDKAEFFDAVEKLAEECYAIVTFW